MVESSEIIDDIYTQETRNRRHFIWIINKHAVLPKDGRVAGTMQGTPKAGLGLTGSMFRCVRHR